LASCSSEPVFEEGLTAHVQYLTERVSPKPPFSIRSLKIGGDASLLSARIDLGSRPLIWAAPFVLAP